MARSVDIDAEIPPPQSMAESLGISKVRQEKLTDALEAARASHRNLLAPIESTIPLAKIISFPSQAPEWQEFVNAITPVIAITARRVSLLWGDSSASTVNDIVQDVFLKLMEDNRRILREFGDRGNESFLKLLRMSTASVATDYFRRARAAKRGGRSEVASLTDVAPAHRPVDVRAISSVEWPALMGQLDGLLRANMETVSSRDRQIFWLYYRQGLSAQAISKIPGMELTPKGVESVLRRLAQTLRDTISKENQSKNPHEMAAILKLEKKYAAI